MPKLSLKDKSKRIAAKTKGLGYEFLLINLANVLVLTGSVMFVLLPEYLQTSGMERWEIGLVDGSFWFISIFVQPWLGPRLDKDGRKLYLILGALLMALAATTYSFIPVEIGPMVLSRLVHGFGFACYLTASWTWVADYSPPSRMGEFFGIFGISGLIAGTIGPGAAEYLVNTRQSYSELFFWGAGLIMVGWTVLLFLSDHRPQVKSKREGPSFFVLAKARSLRGMILGSIAFGVGMGSIFAFIAPYMATLELEGVGPLFACTTIASGVSRVYAGRLTDRVGPSLMVAPALLLLALGAFGLGQVAFAGKWAKTVLVFSGMAVGLGYGVVYPALNAIAVRRLSNTSRGRGLSLVTASVDCGSTGGAALAGFVSHHYGFTQAFRAVAVSVVALLILFSMAEKANQKRAKRDTRLPTTNNP